MFVGFKSLFPQVTVSSSIVARFAGTGENSGVAVDSAPTSAVLVAPGALFLDTNGQ